MLETLRHNFTIIGAGYLVRAVISNFSKKSYTSAGYFELSNNNMSSSRKHTHKT
jgi:hypothetical protein